MPLTPEISSASIVLVGFFNPLIFRPEWCAKRGALTEKDAEEAQIEVIHPDLVSYGVKPWLKVTLEQTKFTAVVLQDPAIKLFDFVVSCFSNLPETPISQIGINRELHFNLGTEAKWHALGDKLAPKTIWGDFMTGTDGKRKGGLLSLTMQQKPRTDEFKGQMNFAVNVSPAIRYGVSCQVNDHYDLTDNHTLRDARDAVELLKSRWEASIAQSEALIQHMVAQD
jgi:hypothetical protein